MLAFTGCCGEREWNEAVVRESACSLFRRVNVAVAARELAENTASGIGGRNTLRSVVRQGSALRSDRCAALRGATRGPDCRLRCG